MTPCLDPLMNHLQEMALVTRKIRDLLSRITTLEAPFATRPGDVAEQRRRSELLRYVIVLPLGPVLSSSQ